MGGYTKNIAVIKGLKEGFSADGGPLTGLVKAEKYGANLRIEVTFINFAPLSEGRYATAVSDGKTTVLVENGLFEGQSSLDTGSGFAALVCYINGQVSPIASAVSGNFHGAALTLKQEAERLENIFRERAGKPAPTDGGGAVAEALNAYEDEAIAEVNYYEFAEVDEGGGAVCQNPPQAESGSEAVQDEAGFGAFAQRKGGVDPVISLSDASFAEGNPLSGGDFYERMKGEIEGILNAYPHEEQLESLIEGSVWVKISYGEKLYYVFGIIKDGGKPRYICYGVPAKSNSSPPDSMAGLATFLPLYQDEKSGGYWVMYQDAGTGASLKIDHI